MNWHISYNRRCASASIKLRLNAPLIWYTYMSCGSYKGNAHMKTFHLRSSITDLYLQNMTKLLKTPDDSWECRSFRCTAKKFWVTFIEKTQSLVICSKNIFIGHMLCIFRKLFRSSLASSSASIVPHFHEECRKLERNVAEM